MKKENIHLKGENYILYIQYQQDNTLRQEFNRLTQQFWGFDFESYYQSGYWDESCILYSLFDGDKIVSHATVSFFDSVIMDESKRLVQIGTVMTDENYQKRGLSRFLMERIQADFEQSTDGMFLFANETVLDYYPKFGLVSVPEFKAVQSTVKVHGNPLTPAQKLDLEVSEELSLFERLVENSVPNSQMTCKSKGLSFFYTYAYPEMGYKDSLYYIPSLDCAVLAEIDEGTLHITELFSTQRVDLSAVISAFTTFEFDSVSLGFTPLQDGFTLESWKDDDLQLFVSVQLKQLFEENKLIAPLLSHT
ncbi:GNAT family N-acetyltransferase [Sphingobacterium faecale]|uniref:GNAT family N-acetyltransferase n=1 Tax=Sphingobacterium faecale TaxID=2803775 RepID=A0ABS1R186_9SPHI|nr:GNAT family N-acetyltransferase [Sphingobacterium faecale]MBL1408455.1 GNAT family N-acetyltransferase [Sphingobacterium faecale]